MKKTRKIRNPMALELLTHKYRKRIERKKKGKQDYSRKVKHKGKEDV